MHASSFILQIQFLPWRYITLRQSASSHRVNDAHELSIICSKVYKPLAQGWLKEENSNPENLLIFSHMCQQTGGDFRWYTDTEMSESHFEKITPV